MPKRPVPTLLVLLAATLLAGQGARATVHPTRAAARPRQAALAATPPDRSWLLAPGVFDRLSSGGRRGALLVNGLLRPAEPRPQPVKLEAAAPPAALAAPAALRNVRVNDPSLDTAGHTNSESSIAVRGAQVVVAFNDAQSDVSGYAFSADGGATFTHRQLPPPPGGNLLGDPVVAFGPGGELYYSTLMADGNGLLTVGVAKSTDGGATFSTPVDAASFVTNAFDSQDKPWLAVDANPASPKKGNVYVAWTDFYYDGNTQILFTRSTDGGKTFSTPVGLSVDDAAGVQGVNLAVAPNGDVYAVYEDGHVSPDGISVLRSTDGGVTFSAPKAIAAMNSLVTLTGGNGLRANSFPMVAVDGNGVAHVVWAATSSGATLDRADVFYSRSTNAGGTWSAPVRLNDDGTTTTQAFPAIAATADGSVAVKWVDRRNDPRNDALTDVYMRVSRDSGATFGPSFRVTDHDWVYGPVERAYVSDGYHGDYDGLAADGTTFYASWSDERGTDPDVYFAQVPEAYDARTPDFGLAARQPYGALKAGGSLTIDVASAGSNGFAAPILLSTGAGASGIALTLSSATVSPGDTARLTVSTTPQAKAGDYLVVVSGTANGVERATNVWLTVYDGSRPVSPPANLTGTAGFSAGAGVKADASGVLHLLYEDDTNAVLGEDVFYRRSTDGGATFSSPKKLNAAGSFGIQTSLAVDSAGRVLAVWAGQASGDTSNRVYVARSTDGGATFSAPAAVTPSGQFAQFPTVAIGPSGAVLVAYHEVAGSPSTLRTIRSTDGGATFAAPVTFSDGSASEITHPGLAFDSKGNAYLGYTAQALTSSGTASWAQLAKAAPGGAFGAPVLLSDSAAAAGFGPDVAVGPDDSVAVVFYNRLGGTTATNREIAFVRSTDGGTTFSPQVNLSNNAGQSYFPSVTVEAGGAIDVVWEDSTGNAETDVFVSRSTDGGKTFAGPLNVSSNLGLSGSQANPIDVVPAGGSGRVAVSAAPNGTLWVSWTDDSSANPDVYVSALAASAVSALPPTAAITSPASGSSFEAGVPVSFAGTGADPAGGAVTYSWAFGDGRTASGAAPPPHAYAVPGTYAPTLTVTAPSGLTATATVSVTVKAPSVTGSSLLLPVVLEAPGLAGSRYTSEVTLASRAAVPTEVLLTYTASRGGGSGFARLTLAPGEMRVVPSVVSALRGSALPIPDDGQAHVGTLLVTFAGADPGTVFAGARTFTANPNGGAGTFGLFYTSAASTSSSATLIGLQQGSSQRSNLAVVNAGPDPVTLRIALQGPNGEDLGTLPDQALGPWGWNQLNEPLAGLASSGRAVVTRVAGASPFTAYAVLNDQVTSDGSYVPPLLPGGGSADRLLPIVLDAQGVGARFRTELTLTNLTSAPLPVTLVYTAATAAGLGTGSGSVPLTLAAGQQTIIGDAIAYLRGTLPIPSGDANVGGSLLVKAPAGTPASALGVGARTFVPLSPSGSYGLFYTGLSPDESAASPAYVYGLAESSGQRSNLAVVNRGDAGDSISVLVTFFGTAGNVLGTATRSLAPGEWTQLNRPLADLGATAGYARVEKISGTSRFVAYGVLNDNITSDGSYVPMSR